MEIFINLSDDKIKILNNNQKYQFSNSVGKVAILLESSNLKNILNEIIEKNLPIIILAGTLSNKDNEITKMCLESGVLPQSLIYKDKDNLIDYNESKTFNTKVPRGVGVNALIELAEYANINSLIAEFIIWNPDDISSTEEFFIDIEESQKEVQVKPKEASKHSEPIPIKREENRPVKQIEEISQPKKEEKAVQKHEKQEQTREPHSNAREVRKVELDSYIRQYEQVILLLRLSEKADSLPIINDLQNKYPATLLEIERNLTMFTRYASNQNKAVITGDYSYYEDGMVSSGVSSNNILLVDINILGDYSDLVNDMYDISAKTYFIISTTQEQELIGEEVNSLKDWHNNDLTINGVIVPNDKLREIFTREFNDIVCFSNEVIL